MLEQLTLNPDALVPTRSAVISPDGLYRYRLDRRWAPGSTVGWVAQQVLIREGHPLPGVHVPSVRRTIALSRVLRS